MIIGWLSVLRSVSSPSPRPVYITSGIVASTTDATRAT